MSAASSAPLLERGLPLFDRIGSAARPGEVVLGWLRAESSDFVRFNHGRVRQAGTVERALLELRLVRDARQATLQFVLSGHEATDADRLGAALAELRGLLADSQPDPWLSLCEQPREQITRLDPALPPREAPWTSAGHTPPPRPPPCPTAAPTPHTAAAARQAADGQGSCGGLCCALHASTAAAWGPVLVTTTSTEATSGPDTRTSRVNSSGWKYSPTVNTSHAYTSSAASRAYS